MFSMLRFWCMCACSCRLMHVGVRGQPEAASLPAVPHVLRQSLTEPGVLWDSVRLAGQAASGGLLSLPHQCWVDGCTPACPHFHTSTGSSGPHTCWQAYLRLSHLPSMLCQSSNLSTSTFLKTLPDKQPLSGFCFLIQLKFFLINQGSVYPIPSTVWLFSLAFLYPCPHSPSLFLQLCFHWFFPGSLIETVALLTLHLKL